MQPFLVTDAAKFGILSFLAGWGLLLAKVLRIRLNTHVGFAIAVRQALRSRVWSVYAGAGLLLVSLISGVALFVRDLASPAQSISAFSPPAGAGDSSSAQDSVTIANSEPESRGPAVNLNPRMSIQELQSGLLRAPRGARILFAAGTYHLPSSLIIPCKNLHITGPEATTPTAILSASFRNGDSFVFMGGCAELGSIRYLHFEDTGAVYFGVGDNSNLTFEHNLITDLPSGLDNNASESGLDFDGSLSTKLKNVVVKYNTFGDDQSCAAVFATVKELGGYCAGILASQGEINNITIEHNNFIHVEQGIHFFQVAAFKPGEPNSVCITCTISYNYILNYHRIGIEIQTSTPTDPIRLEHNAIVDPVNSSWGTFAVSLACCQSGFTQTVDGHSPGFIFDDNVLIATLPLGSECPPFGVEFWGTGSQGTNSLIQGTFCHGYTWGYGKHPWAIKHNYICGPNFLSKGGYITNEEHRDNPPEQSENVVAPTCSVTASLAPTITPAGGSFTGPEVVTLRGQGLNTGIWYTTDGSTPVPGSGTARYYTAPFTISTNTTVKAVGMWGAMNQPVRYPAGYGYVPSEVVAASYKISASVSMLRPF